MINKKVKDERGTEFTLIQFVVIEDKLMAVLETADGKYWTEDSHKIRLVR